MLEQFKPQWQGLSDLTNSQVAADRASSRDHVRLVFLYFFGEGVDSTREVGGNEVKEESVWVCTIESFAQLYKETWNDFDRVINNG